MKWLLELFTARRRVQALEIEVRSLHQQRDDACRERDEWAAFAMKSRRVRDKGGRYAKKVAAAGALGILLAGCGVTEPEPHPCPTLRESQHDTTITKGCEPLVGGVENPVVGK